MRLTLRTTNLLYKPSRSLLRLLSCPYSCVASVGEGRIASVLLHLGDERFDVATEPADLGEREHHRPRRDGYRSELKRETAKVNYHYTRRDDRDRDEASPAGRHGT